MKDKTGLQTRDMDHGICDDVAIKEVDSFGARLRGWRVSNDLFGRYRLAPCRALSAAFIVLFPAGLSISSVQAQQSLSTIIEADAGNYYAPGHSISTKILASGGNSLSNTYAFTGLDGNGTTGTMSYVVNAKAVASYGSIGASFTATLSNTIYNANNVQWVTNSSGVPDYFDGQADASFSDTLMVQGGSGLSSIKLLVHLNGTLSAVPYYPYGYGYVALWYQLPGGGTTIFRQISANAQSATPVDEMVMTPAFAVSAQGTAKVYVLLQAYAAWELFGQTIPDHQVVPESVNFADTLGVVQVQGFDASGQPVALTSAMGSSGTSYAVPAPSLTIQSSGQDVILSWSNPAFSLQTACTVTGTYTNIPGATSPYTNNISGLQQFFRLKQ
jgi:hypothetical protein